MPSYNNRLIAKIEATLAARTKMIVVRFVAREGGYEDRPPLCIGGSKAAQARVLAEWEKSRDSLPRRVANADVPSQSPDTASLSPDAETGQTPGARDGAE